MTSNSEHRSIEVTSLRNLQLSSPEIQDLLISWEDVSDHFLLTRPNRMPCVCEAVIKAKVAILRIPRFKRQLKIFLNIIFTLFMFCCLYYNKFLFSGIYRNVYNIFKNRAPSKCTPLFLMGLSLIHVFLSRVTGCTNLQEWQVQNIDHPVL